MSYVPITVNVSAFGAVGNGINDDTSAITRALAAAGTNSTVIFEPGRTYKTTSFIEIPANGMTLSGYGAVITSATSAQWEKFQMTSKTGIKILGLTFNCLYSTVSAQTEPTIDILSCTDVSIRDCFFNDTPKAIRISAASLRVNVEFNFFYKNFLSVFVDDDGGGNDPMRLRICNNEFRTGLGGTNEAFSGGVKISGTGSSSSLTMGNVISNNVIDTVGQMGIELQGVNDCTIVGNSIFGTGYGVSLNGCYRIVVGDNIVRNIIYYGLEATTCDSASFSGNVVSTTTATADLVLESGTNTVITGGSLSGGATGVHAFGNRITIVGVHFSLNTSSCVNMQGASDVNISGCFFNQQAMARFLGIDATDYAMARINIVGCIFKGTTTDQGFMVSSTNGHATTDITVSSNNTAGAVAAGGAFWTLGGSSLLTSFLRNRSFNNVGDGTATSPTKTFNVGYTATSSNLSMPYAYPQYEGGTIDFDASGGTKTMQLPAATGLTGYTVTIGKSDSSANSVVVSVYGSGLINGVSSYTISTQYSTATFRSNGTNWTLI